MSANEQPQETKRSNDDNPQGREIVVSQSDLDIVRLESKMKEMMYEQRLASMEREFAIRNEHGKDMKMLEVKLARMEGREEAAKEAALEAKKTATAQIPGPHMPYWTGSLQQSTILMPHHQQQLLATQPGNWTMIYRASVHGQTSANFHACCDNRGPTFVVIRSGANVFGGFASMPWNSQSNNYLNAPGCFLFTAVSPYGDAFSIFPCSSPGHAMYCHSGRGPTFGGGNDLYVVNNCLTANSSCNPGNSYTVTTGRGTSAFVGSTAFLASEVEVFARI